MSEVSTVTEIVQPNPIISVDTLNHQFDEYPMVSYSSTNNGPYIADTFGISKIESFVIKVKFKRSFNCIQLLQTGSQSYKLLR